MATRAATASKRSKRGPRQAPPKILEAITQHRKQLAVARACYGKAEQILAELQAKLGVGKRVAIGSGLYAEVADIFAAGDTVWKHQAVRRYDLRITDEDGKEARLRDRKRPAARRRAKK